LDYCPRILAPANPVPIFGGRRGFGGVSLIDGDCIVSGRHVQAVFVSGVRAKQLSTLEKGGGSFAAVLQESARGRSCARGAGNPGGV